MLSIHSKMIQVGQMEEGRPAPHPTRPPRRFGLGNNRSILAAAQRVRLKGVGAAITLAHKTTSLTDDMGFMARARNARFEILSPEDIKQLKREFDKSQYRREPPRGLEQFDKALVWVNDAIKSLEAKLEKFEDQARSSQFHAAAYRECAEKVRETLIERYRQQANCEFNRWLYQCDVVDYRFDKSGKNELRAKPERMRPRLQDTLDQLDDFKAKVVSLQSEADQWLDPGKKKDQSTLDHRFNQEMAEMKNARANDYCVLIEKILDHTRVRPIQWYSDRSDLSDLVKALSEWEKPSGTVKAEWVS